MNATPNAEAVQAADEVLKPTEIAEELKVSADIVCQWIKAGELTATLVSVDRASKKPLFRVRREDLERFLADRETRPPADRRRARRGTTWPQIV